jgi:hypothetical protein
MNQPTDLEQARQEMFNAHLRWHHVTLHPFPKEELSIAEDELHDTAEHYLETVDKIIGRTP